MTRYRENIEAIVLAAGKGERMGSIKPLIDIDGTSALQRVVQTLDHVAVDRITVVLGYHAEEIKASVDLSGCRIVINEDYETGMGSSVSRGARLVSSTSMGFLIAHADMPYIEETSVAKVVEIAKTGARIVAPAYQGRRGFPVYLQIDCLMELLPTLKGEIGARDYISAHSDEVVIVEVDDPGVVRDIDWPEDVIGD